MTASHRYEGDDDLCARCDKPKAAAVHVAQPAAPAAFLVLYQRAVGQPCWGRETVEAGGRAPDWSRPRGDYPPLYLRVFRLPGAMAEMSLDVLSKAHDAGGLEKLVVYENAAEFRRFYAGPAPWPR